MQTYTEVAKLVGTGAIGKSYQGRSVKLIDDGNSLFVGGNGDNDIGAVWFYQKISSVWTQKQKIVPTGSIGTLVFFGSTIAVNPSMSTMIVGAFGDNNRGGASFVFTFDGTTWSQQAKLIGSNSSTDSYQGYSVGLSADGNTAIMGGQYDASNVGAVWIFVRTGTVWSQQGPKLVGSGTLQGFCVAITSDGNLAVVGGDQVFFIYLRSNGVWSQVGSTAVNIVSLALSGDDKTLVVGGSSSTLVFKRNGNTFTQFKSKLTGFSGYANSVTLNKKGTIITLGNYRDSNDVGAVFMYYFNGTDYNQLGNKIVAPDSIGSARQGISVSLDGTGSQLLFGGYFDNNNAGAAWVYNNITVTAASPSVVPTTQPSSRPTIEPTTSTTQPSSQPTSKSTTQPTTQPTSVPINKQTTQPTMQPSSRPTTQPTAPTTSTTQPSSLQTAQPTTQPTTKPTLQPSSGPTAQPTMEPTSKPTQPTMQPSTAQPIAASSNALFLGLGALIGVIVGGIVLLLIIVAVCVFMVYRKVAGGNQLSSSYHNTMSARFVDMANPMRSTTKNNAKNQDNDMNF